MLRKIFCQKIWAEKSWEFQYSFTNSNNNHYNNNISLPLFPYENNVKILIYFLKNHVKAQKMKAIIFKKILFVKMLQEIHPDIR